MNPASALGDLDRARLSVDKRLQERDLATLLVIIGAIVGAERAVVSAVKSLGADSVNDLVSYLEPAAIRMPPGSGRDGLKRCWPPSELESRPPPA